MSPYMRWAAALAVATIAITLSRPVRADDTGLDIGAFAGVHVFADDNELSQFNRDDADSPTNSVALGLRAGYGLLRVSKLTLGAEAEFAVIPSKERDAGTGLLVFAWRAHAVALLDLGSRVRPLAVAGFGALTATSTDTATARGDTDSFLYTGIGAKVAVTSNLDIRLDTRALFLPSSNGDGLTTDFEVLVALSRRFGTSKPKALPPPDPEPVDTDGDGINDVVDKCPRDAEDMDGFQDDDGCPDLDNDKDGIPDARDKCPNEAETKNGIDDDDGCPETDFDQDGLLGSKDKCPRKAEDKDGFQDDDGCPDPDNDGDGVLDANDKCPFTLETMNGYQDDDGCPDTLPKQVAQYTGVIKGIYFHTRSSRIRSRSRRALRKAVRILTKYPGLRIEIAGHTDSEGNSGFNMQLSLRRAAAVRKYLVRKGVAGSRLVAKGYGFTKPVGNNRRSRGRAKNRRVEFTPLVGP